jgi:hypothetical protein
LKELETNYQQQLNTQAMQWKSQVEIEVSKRVEVETEARVIEAMNRM